MIEFLGDDWYKYFFIVTENDLVYPDHQDYITVQLCIKYVEDGYSLTKESLECLNLIHKRNA
jgi:hypothetical protein